MARDFGKLSGPGGPMDDVPDGWWHCAACDRTFNEHDLHADDVGTDDPLCPHCGRQMAEATEGQIEGEGE